MRFVPKSQLVSTGLKPHLQVRAPGRITLIGEHTDYNGGKVLPFAIDRAITMRRSNSDDRVARHEAVYTVVSDASPDALEISAHELQVLANTFASGDRTVDLRPHLPKEIASSWARYVVGALIWHFHLGQGQHWFDESPRQIRIDLTSTLPIGAGISSSAALCTGLLALLARSERIDLELSVLARQAMFIEHQFSGTRCGLMDQMAVALSEADSLLLIDFKDLQSKDAIQVNAVHAHQAFHDFRPVLINTMVRHDLGSSPYNERRLMCEEGLRLLNDFNKLTGAAGGSYPSLGHAAADRTFLQRFAPDGKQATMVQNLGSAIFAGKPVHARRVAHAIMETVRVDQAVAALRSGDLGEFTTAVNASHISLRDDYEVSCAELDLIRTEALSVAATLGTGQGFDPILGARMTGGGFGGSTIQLVHHSIVPGFVAEMGRQGSAYHQTTGLVPEVMVTGFASGLQVSTAT